MNNLFHIVFRDSKTDPSQLFKSPWLFLSIIHYLNKMTYRYFSEHFVHIPILYLWFMLPLSLKHSVHNFPSQWNLLQYPQQSSVDTSIYYCLVIIQSVSGLQKLWCQKVYFIVLVFPGKTVEYTVGIQT